MSDRRYPRTARVNEVVREVVAEELEILSDPRLELVTITGVDVSPDLKHARVFYSVMSPPGDITSPPPRGGAPAPPAAVTELGTNVTGEGRGEENRARAAKALAASRRHLQAALGRQVRMKYVPRLVFEEDPAVQTGRRIDDIIRSLHDQRSDDEQP